MAWRWEREAQSTEVAPWEELGAGGVQRLRGRLPSLPAQLPIHKVHKGGKGPGRETKWFCQNQETAFLRPQQCDMRVRSCPIGCSRQPAGSCRRVHFTEVGRLQDRPGTAPLSNRGAPLVPV